MTIELGRTCLDILAARLSCDDNKLTTWRLMGRKVESMRLARCKAMSDFLHRLVHNRCHVGSCSTSSWQLLKGDWTVVELSRLLVLMVLAWWQVGSNSKLAVVHRRRHTKS